MKKLLILGCVLIVIYATVASFNSAYQYSNEEEISRIETTIEGLLLKCYSIEGRYPETISYLKENYGLLVNEDEYAIIYYYEGDNLQPHIEVFQKGEKNE